MTYHLPGAPNFRTVILRLWACSSDEPRHPPLSAAVTSLYIAIHHLTNREYTIILRTHDATTGFVLTLPLLFYAYLCGLLPVIAALALGIFW